MNRPKIHERNDQAQMLEKSISLAADPVMIQCRSSGRHEQIERARTSSAAAGDSHQGGDQQDKIVGESKHKPEGPRSKSRWHLGCDPQSEQQTRVLTGARAVQSRGRPPTTRGVDDEAA
jgi:hypothetical protein